jgi:hypothetical protein
MKLIKNGVGFTRKEIEIAEENVPFLEAAGIDPKRLDPMEIYLQAGELTQNPKVMARKMELARDPAIDPREATLQAIREVYQAHNS